MLRLKPSRVSMYDTMRLPPIQNLFTLTGKTSLIYTTDDPNTLQVFTFEKIKLRWWEHIGLIYSYTDVGTAYFSGFLNGNVYDFREYTFALYMALVPTLEKPVGIHAQQLKAINSRLDQAYSNYRLDYKDNRRLDAWQYIRHFAGNCPEIIGPCEFIEHVSRDYYPDFGEGDFLVWNNQLIATDPFHAKSINPIFWMERTPR